MKLIEATEITDSVLISTNVTEDDHAEWVTGTTYAIGDFVIVLATHSVYEALTASTSLYPPDNLTGDNPAWFDKGSTNARKMFNQSYMAQTVNTDSIVVSFALGRTNSIGLLNVEASAINITMSVGGVEVYNKDIDMRLRTVSNWYEYIYTPLVFKTESVLTDLPTAGDTTLTITLTGSGDVKCGLCIPGMAIQIGESLWGCQVGTDNYGRKEIDIYGGYDMLERGYSKTLTDSIFLQNGMTGYVEKLIQPYYTKAGLWVANEEFEATAVYGPYRDFSIVLAGWDGAQCSITIEGLT